MLDAIVLCLFLSYNPFQQAFFCLLIKSCLPQFTVCNMTPLSDRTFQANDRQVFLNQWRKANNTVFVVGATSGGSCNAAFPCPVLTIRVLQGRDASQVQRAKLHSVHQRSLISSLQNRNSTPKVATPCDFFGAVD